MIEHTVNKSYMIVDTPESCIRCQLSTPGSDYRELICPLLGTSFSSDHVSEEWKDEKCPLKPIEFSVKIDI